MKKEDLCLYAVSDRTWLDGRSLEDVIEIVIDSGATMLQLREKNMDHNDFVEEARRIKKITDAKNVPLIINDDIDVCLEVDASGVHVGQSDMAAEDVRAKIGPDKILGVTAKTVEQALAAQAAGADYLGSGAVFGSQTKKDALAMSMDQLKAITEAVDIPVVAIGGIDAGNILLLQGAGLAGAAVVSGIFAQRDIAQAVCTLKKLCEKIIQ